jgi:hypothetical protein
MPGGAMLGRCYGILWNRRPAMARFLGYAVLRPLLGRLWTGPGGIPSWWRYKLWPCINSLFRPRQGWRQRFLEQHPHYRRIELEDNLS